MENRSGFISRHDGEDHVFCADLPKAAIGLDEVMPFGITGWDEFDRVLCGSALGDEDGFELFSQCGEIRVRWK